MDDVIVSLKFYIKTIYYILSSSVPKKEANISIKLHSLWYTATSNGTSKAKIDFSFLKHCKKCVLVNKEQSKDRNLNCHEKKRGTRDYDGEYKRADKWEVWV